MTEVAFYQYLLLGAGTLISLGVVVIGWFFVQQLNDYREHKQDDTKKHEALELANKQLELDLIASTRSLDQYKTYAAENFARNETMKDSLADMRKIVEDGFKEQRIDAKEQRQDVKDLRKEIQTLLTNKA